MDALCMLFECLGSFPADALFSVSLHSGVWPGSSRLHAGGTKFTAVQNVMAAAFAGSRFFVSCGYFGRRVFCGLCAFKVFFSFREYSAEQTEKVHPKGG